MELKKPKFGRNRWCGPSALSIVTGLDTDYLAQLCEESGAKLRRGVVKSVQPSVIVKTAVKLGYRAELAIVSSHHRDKAPTFRDWVTDTTDGVWIVMVSAMHEAHWVVVDAGKRIASDNGAMLSTVPVPVTDKAVTKPLARRRVSRAVRICKGDEYIPSASVRTFRLAEKVTGKWGRLSADALRERFNETFTRAEAMETMRLAEAIPSYHTPSSWFARMVEAKRIVEAATT